MVVIGDMGEDSARSLLRSSETGLFQSIVLLRKWSSNNGSPVTLGRKLHVNY